jgi:hypothetical protein
LRGTAILVALQKHACRQRAVDQGSGGRPVKRIGFAGL